MTREIRLLASFVIPPSPSARSRKAFVTRDILASTIDPRAVFVPPQVGDDESTQDLRSGNSLSTFGCGAASWIARFGFEIH